MAEIKLPGVMNQESQQDAFAKELDRLVSYFIEEFELSLASAIGVLEVKKLQIVNDLLWATHEEDED